MANIYKMNSKITMEAALQVGSSLESSPTIRVMRSEFNIENMPTSRRIDLTETRQPPPMSKFVETLDPMKLMEQYKKKKHKRQPTKYESIDSRLKRLDPNILSNPTAHNLQDLIGLLEKDPPSISKTETLSSNSESTSKIKRRKYKKSGTFTEKTLEEIGAQKAEPEIWAVAHQPKKDNLYDILRVMVREYTKPNIQIRCGGIIFNCHMMVLQCYSDFFMDCENEVCIDLPDTDVKPSAFVMIYDWMITEKPCLPRFGLLDVFIAANYLGMRSLISQCWLCFDDDRRFKEESACLLYLEAKQSNRDGLESLRYLMLIRISRFFLTFVASKEFLELEPNEICCLLSSNAIGVNSEIEVLFAAMRWLRVNWRKRQVHIYDIALCIRYSLIPSWFLVSMMNSDESDIFIKEIIKFPPVRKLIDDGISYGTTLMYYGKNREQFKVFVNRFKLVLPAQRQWIFDVNCKYHRKMNMEESDRKYINITYSAFLSYLSALQTVGKDYWQTIDLAKDEEHPLTYCLQPDMCDGFDILTAEQVKLKEDLAQCRFDDKRSPVAVILRDVEIDINRLMDNNDNCRKSKDVQQNVQLLRNIMHESKIFNTEPSAEDDDASKTHRISDYSTVKPARAKAAVGERLSREKTSTELTLSENTIKMNEKTIREMNERSIKEAIFDNNRRVRQKHETIDQSKAKKSKKKAGSPSKTKIHALQDRKVDVQKLKERQQLIMRLKEASRREIKKLKQSQQARTREKSGIAIASELNAKELLEMAQDISNEVVDSSLPSSSENGSFSDLNQNSKISPPDYSDFKRLF